MATEPEIIASLTAGMSSAYGEPEATYEEFAGAIAPAIVLGGSGAAGGDVTGPASSTTNGVVVFDGTSGKVIKGATAAVDFGGQNITNVGSIAGLVPTSRQINNGTGISGGGDLTADRTLSVNQGALDPSNMDSTGATDGQLATADGLGGIAWEDAAAGGGGDVSGPGSSTDHGLARYHGATGKIIQNSGVTLSDGNAMVFPSSGSISCRGSGSYSEKFGVGAVANGTSATAIGRLAEATHNDTTVVGAQADGKAAKACAFGKGALVNTGAINSIAIGYGTEAKGSATNCVAVGYYAEASTNVDHSGALGTNAKAAHDQSWAFGRAAITTATNRVTFGQIGTGYLLELQCGDGFGCFGVTPPGSQPAKISDPTDLASCVTAITAIIDVLEGAGLSST